MNSCCKRSFYFIQMRKVTGVAPQHDKNRNGVFDIACCKAPHQAIQIFSESVNADWVIVDVHGENIIQHYTRGYLFLVSAEKKRQVHCLQKDKNLIGHICQMGDWGKKLKLKFAYREGWTLTRDLLNITNKASTKSLHK